MSLIAQIMLKLSRIHYLNPVSYIPRPNNSITEVLNRSQKALQILFMLTFNKPSLYIGQTAEASFLSWLVKAHLESTLI